MKLNGIRFQVLKAGEGPKARNGQKVTIRVVDTGFGVDNVREKTFILGFSMVVDGLSHFFTFTFFLPVQDRSYSFKYPQENLWF